MHFNNSIAELAASYNLDASEVRLLKRASKLLDSKLRKPSEHTLLTSPFLVRNAARMYFALTHAGKEHEVFTVMYLDGAHRLIATVDAFTGTIDAASVYPREIVKQALRCNAVAVLFIHNHPTGNPDPSSADIKITDKLVAALKLVDIRVLDHIIIGGLDTVSFAERGLI